LGTTTARLPSLATDLTGAASRGPFFLPPTAGAPTALA